MPGNRGLFERQDNPVTDQEDSEREERQGTLEIESLLGATGVLLDVGRFRSGIDSSRPGRGRSLRSQLTRSRVLFVLGRFRLPHP